MRLVEVGRKQLSGLFLNEGIVGSSSLWRWLWLWCACGIVCASSHVHCCTPQSVVPGDHGEKVVCVDEGDGRDIWIWEAAASARLKRTNNIVREEFETQEA